MIGLPASIQYLEFEKLYKIAEQPDYILDNPLKAKIDYDASIKFAVLTNVVDYAKNDLDLCDKAFIFAGRFEPEYAVAFTQLILKKAPDSCTLPSYQKLARKLGI